jgi:hypothetical protein
MALPLFAVAIFLCYQALQLPMRSLDGGPGAGVVPAGIGVLMLVLAGRLIPADWRERVVCGNLRRVGLLIGVLAVYTLVFERVGFVLASAAMMAALLIGFNPRHRAALAALGGAGTLAVYALFYGALKVQPPPDPWGLWR